MFPHNADTQLLICEDSNIPYVSYKVHSSKGEKNRWLFAIFCMVVFKVATKMNKKEMSKYAVKPPKDLASKFEAKVALKAKEEEEALEQKRRDEEVMKIAVRR